jgi:hypothetical protein
LGIYWDLEGLEKKKWCVAIAKMLIAINTNQEILSKTEIKGIPKNQRLIGSYWVLKNKKSSICCARLCSLGYNQILEINYANKFALLVNNTTFRLVLLCYLVKSTLEALFYNIVTAFHYSKLDELVYIL